MGRCGQNVWVCGQCLAAHHNGLFAQGNQCGRGVVVFPGGGYNALAIDLEGTEICDWLNSVGITAVLLKYRVPTRSNVGHAESLPALQDAQRTLGLVRSRAAEWN